jgi:hypothetical protein
MVLTIVDVLEDDKVSCIDSKIKIMKCEKDYSEYLIIDRYIRACRSLYEYTDDINENKKGKLFDIWKY